MARQGNILSFNEVQSARSKRGSASGAKAPVKKPSKRNSASFSQTSGKIGPKVQAVKKPNTSGKIPATPAPKSSKMAEKKRGRKQAKISKEFAKQFGDTTASTANNGTRAALYKGEMGPQHKKMAQMQNGGKKGAKAARSLAGFGFLSPRFMACIILVACVALSGAFLYPSAQQYYTTVRHYDQLQAEYDAVVQRNDDMRTQVDALSSEEGVEDRARDEFGWVKEGENSVTVYGLESTTQKADFNPQTIPEGSVEAKQAWYTPFLDALFGIQ